MFEKMIKILGVEVDNTDDEEKNQDDSADGTITEIFLIQPRLIDDAKAAVEKIKKGNSIIISLEQIEEKTKLRILDYFDGAADALSYKVFSVSENAWIIIPDEVVFKSENL